MRSSVTNSVTALILVAIGVAVGAAGIYIGDTDDAPGAALIGILLMIGAVALGVMTARRKIQHAQSPARASPGGRPPAGMRAWQNCGMAQHLAQALARLVESELAGLQAVSEEAAGRPGQAGGWSRKEELGHLIDSAANNHQRFVRAALAAEFRGPGYAQADWVQLHGYRELPWATLTAFWRQYNALLARVVERIADEQLATPCVIGDGRPVSLGFLIEDYLLHMQHHLDHILGREKMTEYPGARLGV